jgi:DNA-binding transcriptional LysR family regulator
MSLALSDWDLIATYLAVLRGGSLSAAARTLGLAQPTVRRQVEALEARLGVVLFTRGPGGLVPTEPGAALRQDAEAMEAAAAAFRRNAQANASQIAGIVRVTASVVHGTEVLPGLLAPLLAQHPDLVIEMVPDDRTGDLLRRDADVAVRFVPPVQAALVAQRVAPVPIGLFAAPAYLERHGAPTSWDMLAHDHAFVGDDRRRAIADGLARLGLPLPKRLAWRTDADLGQVAAIRAGIGIGLAQVVLADRVGLVRVLPAITAQLDAWVVSHEDLAPVARVRAVFDALVAGLRNPEQARG